MNLTSAFGQGTPGDRPTAPVNVGVPEVVILVLPMTPDSARITSVYDRRVPRKQVQQEANAVAALLGAPAAENVIVEEKGVTLKNSNRTTSTPATSSVSFSVRNAGLYRGAVPATLPYLRAYQAWNRIEVLFQQQNVQKDDAPETFKQEAVQATLHKDNGLYRLEATILKRDAPIPEPDFRGAVPTTPNANALDTSGTQGRLKDETGASPWLVISLFALGALICGAGAYFLFARRSAQRGWNP